MNKQINRFVVVFAVAAFCLLVVQLPLIAQASKWVIRDYQPDHVVFSLYCQDSLSCVALLSGGVSGMDPLVVTTTNGGDSWNVVFSDSVDLVTLRTPARMYKAVMNGSGVILVTVDSGRVFRTSDGGESWNTVSLGPDRTKSVPLLSGFKDGHGLAGSYRDLGDDRRIEIQKTEDGGESWTLLDFPVMDGWEDATVRQAELLDSANYAILLYYQDLVSRFGHYLLVSTSDDGRTWSSDSVHFALPDSVRKTRVTIRMIHQDLIYVTGSAAPDPSVNLGFVQHFNRSQDLWFSAYLGQVRDERTDFFFPHFIDSQNGVIGGNRTIYRTSDGGRTWSEDSIEIADDMLLFYTYRFSNDAGIAANWQSGHLMKLAQTAGYEESLYRGIPEGIDCHSSSTVVSRGKARLYTDDTVEGVVGVSVFSLSGEIVGERSEGRVDVDGSVELSLEGVVSGRYFVVLDKDGRRCVLPIVVIE